MKSIKESLGFVKQVSSIDGMPKSAVGILPHQDEERLNILWNDIIKSEDAYLKLSSETGKYCSAIKDIQSVEEKLLKLLGDSNIGAHSLMLGQVIDEYLSVAIENKKISEETSNTAHEVAGVGPDQYHLLYEQLDASKKKRDSYIAEIERCQDKLDRLKLKGKRTTDVIVEKERNLRQFQDANLKLTNEAQNFHNLRVHFLQTCVQASVHNQINYYGSTSGEFNKYIQLSRGAHHIKEKEYMDEVNTSLNKIRNLTIVDK